MHTASQTKSLHLLRSLLREVSYLPDATARDYFRHYIVARFKAYQPKHNATASVSVQAVEKYRHRSFKRRHLAIINERASQQQRKAHKGLTYLRRANQGEGPCMQKVLWFTYGRMGRRKYALLDDLLKPDPTTSLTAPAVAPLQQLYHSNKSFLQYFEAPDAGPRTAEHHDIRISKRYPRLQAVLLSQVQNGVALGSGIRRPYLRTPIRNVWERPMPIKRARNNVRRWYAETMTRLLPALPTAEWDNIEALGTGKLRIAFVKRRTPAVGNTPQPGSDEHNFEQMVQQSLALDTPSRGDRPADLFRPRPITVRFMRRMYSKLLELSCKLEYDTTRGRWAATWGKPLNKTRPKSYDDPVDDALFGGVDAKGIVPKTPKPKEDTLPVRRW